MASAWGTETRSSTKRHPTVPWLETMKVRVLGATPSLDVAARVLQQLGAAVVTDDRTDEDAEWDVVLVDRIARRGPVFGRELATAAEYLRYVDAENRRVWVTASAYGLTTSRADA